MRRGFIAVLMTVTTTFLACAPAGVGRSAQTGDAPDGTSAPKRISAAIRQEPTALAREVTGGEPGTQAMLQLLGAGLVIFDPDMNPRPQLAESAPTAENGLWKIPPDGRMEMTWHIRPNVEWHDGAPFTSSDVAFTTRLAGTIGGFDDPGLKLLDRIETPDPQTVVAYWKQPFIDADKLFSFHILAPQPRHVLEKPFNEEVAGFMQHPHWTQEYVGTGPYRLKEWLRGSYLVVEANPKYALGRPKIDVIEVRFINTMDVMASALISGQIELTLGGTFSLEQALDLKNRAPELNLAVSPIGALRRAAPQLENPNPPVIGNLDFRRALMYATDRQEMNDTLESGMSAPVVSFLPPNQPQYKDIEAPLPRYDYDPRRAVAMISQLGYTRGSDGIFVDSSGKPLQVEMRFHSGLGDDDKMVLTVADYWRRSGVDVDVFPVPFQLRTNIEYRSSRPGFHFSGGTHNIPGLATFTTEAIPRPETDWQGQNHSRYANPEYDALYNKFISSIPMPQRMQALGAVLMKLAVDLPVLPMYYLMDPTVWTNRIMNIGPRQLLSSQAWNAHEWDLR